MFIHLKSLPNFNAVIINVEDVYKPLNIKKKKWGKVMGVMLVTFVQGHKTWVPQ